MTWQNEISSASYSETAIKVNVSKCKYERQDVCLIENMVPLG